MLGACCCPCHPAQGALLASHPLQLPGSWGCCWTVPPALLQHPEKMLGWRWSQCPWGEKRQKSTSSSASSTTRCPITSSLQSPAWDPAPPGSPRHSSPPAAESTGGFACHAARPAVSWEGSSWRAAVSPGFITLLTQEPQWESYSHPGKRSEIGARLCSLTPCALSVRVLLPSVLKSWSPPRGW